MLPVVILYVNSAELTPVAPVPSPQLPLGHLVRTDDVEGVMSVHQFRITNSSGIIVCDLAQSYELSVESADI